MRPTEAVMLTGYIRAHFPSQPVDEYTTDALAESLAPYPAADCRLAVLNIAERGERWCSPTDVKAEVKRIRAKRVSDYGPVEPPRDLDPDDTAAVIDWQRRVTRAIADGNPPPPPRAIESAPVPRAIAELRRKAAADVREGLDDGEPA